MPSGQFTEIPIVDLSAIDGRSALADEMREICHEIGFFVVTHHGVDPALVRAVFDSMRTFFALPEADKLRIDKRSSRHFRGWEPVGAESTNNRPDIREQIDLWTEWPARDGDVEPPYLRLLGPNQWLPDEVLPGHRELILAWFRELRALADRLLRLLSEASGWHRTTCPTTSATNRCRSPSSSRTRPRLPAAPASTPTTTPGS